MDTSNRGANNRRNPATAWVLTTAWTWERAWALAKAWTSATARMPGDVENKAVGGSRDRLIEAWIAAEASGWAGLFYDSCSKLEIDEAFRISNKLGLGLAV